MKQILTTACCLATLVFASYSAQAVFTAPATIEGYDVGSHGKLIIRLSTTNSCTPANQLYAISVDEPYYQSVLSIVLAAQTTNKQVQVWATGCGADGMEGFSRIMVGRVW
jgi:hypothetical protein